MKCCKSFELIIEVKEFLTFAVIAENVVESENDTAKAISSTMPLLSPQAVELISNSESDLPPQRSFPIQKLGETIAPRERGFPLPEIRRVEELGASEFKIDEEERSSTTSPFIIKFDRSVTNEAQFDHFGDQNATEEE